MFVEPDWFGGGHALGWAPQAGCTDGFGASGADLLCTDGVGALEVDCMDGVGVLEADFLVGGTLLGSGVELTDGVVEFDGRRKGNN